MAPLGWEDVPHSEIVARPFQAIAVANCNGLKPAQSLHRILLVFFIVAGRVEPLKKIANARSAMCNLVKYWAPSRFEVPSTAMGHWQFRCLRPVTLQSFVCRRKIVSIQFSNLLLNSIANTAGGKRARNAPDAGGARCAHAANRYTRNTHAGKIGAISN